MLKNNVARLRLNAILASVCATALMTMPNVAAARGDPDVLRIVPIGDLQNVDPIWSTVYVSRNHGYLVFDTLFAADENLEMQPQMVDHWEVSDDNLVYTFTLREGMTWHDGEPVLAEDCVASIERWAARDGMGQTLFENVQSIDAVDDLTFTITLERPVGFVIEALGKLDSTVPFMMPKRLAETDPFEQISEVIGSGPFRFVQDEWSPGTVTVYERFEDYVPRDEPPSLAAGGKVVHFDRVEWHYLPDSTTAVSALQTGEVDFLERPPHDFQAILEADPDIQVDITDPVGTQYFMAPNHLYPPFDDPRARQALLHLVDQEAFLQSSIGDPTRYSECYAFWACGSPLASDVGSEALAGVDLDRARELFEETGWDFDEPIVVLDPTDRVTLHALALVTAEMLRSIGLTVELRAMDWGTLISSRASQEPPSEGGWNLFSTSAVAAGITNPIVNTFAQTTCDEAWFGWSCDEEAAELRTEWGYATDPDEQMALAEALQERLYEVVPYVILGQFQDVVAYRSDLEGVIQGPAQFYWNMRRAEVQ